MTGLQSRRGSVMYVMVTLLALALGAAGVWAFLEQSVLADDRPAERGWVWIPSGADSIRAWVAYPDRTSPAAAIIVIHEIYGLTEWEPTVADRLARAGYVAVVPDLLSSQHGMTPASQDSARALVASLAPDQVTRDLDATFAWLTAQEAVRGDDIATIGFCWGGGQSFRYATTNPALRAAVVCYGPAPAPEALAEVRAPVLGVYGENDARINAEVPAVEERMRQLGKRFVAETYPGTGHGFLKPGRRGSDGPQVDRAWTRILNFYRETLGR